MTSQVPLLPAGSGASASASPEQVSRPLDESAGRGTAQSFSRILGAQPRSTGRHDAPATGGRGPSTSAQENAKEGSRGGKALPVSARRGTGGEQAAQAPPGQPPAARSEEGAGGGNAQPGRPAPGDKVRKSAPATPELVDMLKALLAGDPGESPSAGPPLAHSPTTSQGQAAGEPPGGDSLSRLLTRLEARDGGAVVPDDLHGQASSNSGSPTMAQLLKDLTDGSPRRDQAVRQALAAVQAQGGHQAGALAPGSQGTPGGSPWNASLAALQHLVTQPGDPGPQGSVQQALTAAAHGGGAAARFGSDAGGLIEQILAQAAPPKGLDSLTKSAGVTGGDGAGSTTPTFSTVYSSPMMPAQPGAGGPPVTPMPQPFNRQAWDDALGQNVMWMAKNNVQSASLHLNPPQLGPLELKVSINHDQANVSFVVHHGAVRDAIEGALPRLRDMFGDGGVNLANVNVSDHSASGQHASGSDQGTGGGPAGDGTPQEGAAAVADGHGPVMVRMPLGLVDFFA